MKTTFNLNDGWQISSSLSFSYNHEAQSIQEWALPVGFDVSKTSVLGGRQQVYSAPEVTAFVQIKAEQCLHFIKYWKIYSNEVNL